MFFGIGKNAEKEASQVRQQAAADGEAILQAARNEAGAITSKAQIQAQETLLNANLEVKKSASQLEKKVEHLKGNLLDVEREISTANTRKEEIEGEIKAFAEQAEKVALSVEEKLGTLSVRACKVIVGEKTFNFSEEAISKFRGSVLYNLFLHPNFEQSEKAIELPEDLPEVFTYIHRFVMSRTGVIFGLNTLNKNEIEEIRELGKYYLLGNDEALSLFEMQLDGVSNSDKSRVVVEVSREAFKGVYDGLILRCPFDTFKIKREREPEYNDFERRGTLYAYSVRRDSVIEENKRKVSEWDAHMKTHDWTFQSKNYRETHLRLPVADVQLLNNLLSIRNMQEGVQKVEVTNSVHVYKGSRY